MHETGRGSASTGDDAVALARRFHESSDDADPDQIAGWIHEDAEMSLAMTHFETVRGRSAIVHALFNRRESLLYSAEVESCEWLDDETLMVRGQARYALTDRGVTHSPVWWLDEFRDGLRWRVGTYVDEAEAWQAYAHKHDEALSTG